SDLLPEGGKRRRLTGQFLLEGRLALGRVKNGVLVAVERKRYAFAPKPLDHDGHVALQCFGRAEGGRDHFPGGVIDDAVQGEHGTAILQPGIGRSIDLPQHARLRFAGPGSVSLRTTAQPRGTEAAFQENAAHRRDAQADLLVFGQQLGKVSGIATEVALLIQVLHALFERISQGMNGLSAPISVSDGLYSSETIFGLEPIRLPDTDVKRACDILFRETTVDPFFENHRT